MKRSFVYGRKSERSVLQKSVADSQLGKVAPGKRFDMSALQNKLALLERLTTTLGNDSALALDSIAPRSGGNEAEVSYAQRGMWFEQQRKGGDAIYNCVAALRLTGELKREALERSLREVQRRHEALRTRFEGRDGEPVQVIVPEAEFAMEYREVSGSEESEELIAEEARRPFDLGQVPLFRALLVKEGEERHVLVFNIHHIVADGWSIGVLVREVASLYGAYARGEEGKLGELAIQYADYAVWQRENLKGERLAGLLGYWKKQLTDAPAMLLPTDHARSGVRSNRGGKVEIELGEELSAKLRGMSRKAGVTLFMSLLAGFAVLLKRYSGQEDVVVGTPVANRPRAELEELIGFFVNVLVLRMDVTGELTFRELLERVREVTLEAYAHQEAPFEQVVEELQPMRELGQKPLFQVVFALQNAPQERLELTGLEVQPLEVGRKGAEVSQFELALNLREVNGSVYGALEYSADLFEEETIRRMAGHYRELLEGAVEDSEQRVSELPMLTGEEREQLLREWNDEEWEAAAGCVHEWFEEQVAKEPEARAVVRGEEEWSYRELNERANQIAHALIERGVGAERLVGLCVERSGWMVAGILGIWKAGGAYVPLDAEYPAERLSYMVKDAGVEWIVTQAGLVERLPESSAKVLVLEEEELEKREKENPEGRVKPENLAYVIYTSGSTGQPKGVMVEHRNVSSTLHSVQESYPFVQRDVMPSLSPYSFDISLLECIAPLLAGGATQIVGREEVLDMSKLIGLLRSATCLHAVPSLMHYIVEEAEKAPESWKRMRRVWVGGEAVSEQLLERLMKCFREAEIVVLYGPTEATIVSAGCAVRGEQKRRNLVGRALAKAQLRVYDKGGQLAPVGVPGELYIGGAVVARGYWGRTELTKEKFIEIDGRRFYRSGDAVRRGSTGMLEYLGRIDQQLKIRGHRIEPAEIEAAIRELDFVEQVVVKSNQVSDAQEPEILAFISPRGGASVRPDTARQALKGKLPDFMIPSKFVIMPRIPLTSRGKIDHAALAQYVPDRTPSRITLARTPQKRKPSPKSGVKFLRVNRSAEMKISSTWAEALFMLSRCWVVSARYSTERFRFGPFSKMQQSRP